MGLREELDIQIERAKAFAKAYSVLVARAYYAKKVNKTMMDCIGGQTIKIRELERKLEAFEMGA